MQVEQGEFLLRRYPYRKHDSLRAWDAADEFLLNQLAQYNLQPRANVMILNDGFGALTVALHAYHPINCSDSFIAHQATKINVELNGLAMEEVTLLKSLQLPERKPDLLLIKIPKTLALLEYQLIRLQPLLSSETRVIAAGMVKSMPKKVWALFERLLGGTTTSLAWKKARLILVDVDINRVLPENPYPVRYQLENTGLVLSNHANVFSRDRLDIGTRFLLQHLPKIAHCKEMIDLGCGNGVVGLMFAKTHPHARICFVDESYMAIASAQLNFENAFSENRAAQYTFSDCLSGFEQNSADCIVCNPPFHQQSAIDGQIAQKMFRQSRRVLRQGGELWIIGNRHLNYHISLKRLYKQCERVASNNKFVIFRCIQS